MLIDINTRLNLRPHTNQTVRDVICGLGLADEKNLSLYVTKYVRGLIRFLSGEQKEYDAILPTFFFKENIVNETGYGTCRRKMEEIDSLKSIFSIDEGHILILNGLETNLKQEISNFIQALLTSSFEHKLRSYGSYSDNNKPVFSHETLNCFADSNYITWAIQKIPSFVLSEEAIEKVYKTKSIRTFEVIPINDTRNNSFVHINNDYELGHGVYQKSEIILYNPIFNEGEFEFSKKIKDLNSKKSKNLSTSSGANSSEHYGYNHSYEKYNGYNGYSDDVIDDAFEGDRSLTWSVE